ncbi:hypothetical protein C5Y96_02740 [Blastopirellula marina]|uniref:Carboxypeptidase regulatory-like domain-containing protein n=2 Tax=Pirellulales TaxID=2691354 RepID=A0A2S8G4N0_9BACT|nr:hypothetical protein C5Y96_02740 [Blastopirellula marina]RCS55717.1 hypothetical protein DTL36_02745 [Bremerella cremea]
MASASVMLCSGCFGQKGLETAPVSGVVTYNGKPLPYGRVSFRPEAGSPATGAIQSDGSFSLSTYGNGDGAIVGTHQVSITATEADAGTMAEAAANTEMAVPKSLIPKKYTSFSTSELTAEVVARGDNKFTLELRD